MVRSRWVRGVLVASLGAFAVAAPLFAGPLTALIIGSLLILCGVLEMLEVASATEETQQRSAYLSGEMSILAGILLISAPDLLLRGVALLLAVSFGIDGAGKSIAAIGARWKGRPWLATFAGGVVNLGLATMLAASWPVSDWMLVSVVVGLRMFAAGWAMMRGRPSSLDRQPLAIDQYPDPHLNVPPSPVFSDLYERTKERAAARRPIDTTWCVILVLVFLAIHVGRMRVYWNLVGLVGPFAAVVGDLGVALVISFLLILPVRMGWIRLTRPLERRGWNRLLSRRETGTKPGLRDRLLEVWLAGRYRFARAIADMKTSPRAAVRWGLKVGLPLTAVWIAIQPIFGFSWFFNSENWASIVWQRWAETRTDAWRENMSAALHQHYANVPNADLFRVDPGIKGDEDFSFLVIGDNGEGGAAQHSLRAEYLALGKRDDVKFLVVSSDVIYPNGAMIDYEPNFYLPFKGFTKPIYAIPGNHDWYDALEGFAANLLEPDAARICMISRLETDSRLSTTTEGRIDGYIREAARLRKEFGVSAGHQRGPFFEVQTDRFALIAVDTGVMKTVDGAQWRWLNEALARAKGKFKMVILGHPLFTAGYYQGDAANLKGETTSAAPVDAAQEAASFTAIHRLLREHEVDLVMAGDMHLFEQYRESYPAANNARSMHHFVNGGGGAYICVGVPFDWPAKPATPEWAYYPSKAAVIEKLDAQTPLWKMPLWLWVKHFSAWPFNGYIMSAAFDHDHAPFFQSFVEVKVSNSTNEVIIFPYTATGRMRWRELQNAASMMPPGGSPNDAVEFRIPMRKGKSE